ncbi:uncharacterized protein LOC135841093 isoform X1 [Planococcus citri]|uniref:uncharacterized protein LOC135841093 isoform X1 n=1 Tax=Planococcus citri TaxID=170843 RepID=UPI0031F9F164
MASEPPNSSCSNDLAVAVDTATAAVAVAGDQTVSYLSPSSSSKPSSKIRRSKSDKRATECTDSSDEDASREYDSKKRRPRKPPQQHAPVSTPRLEKSGYSSSEESSSAFHQHHHQDIAEHSTRADRVLDEHSDSAGNLRRRRPAHGHHDAHAEAGDSVDAASAQRENADSTFCSNQIVAYSSSRDDAEWELVDKYPKESDISLTEDCQESTEDDFWKSDSQRTPLVAQIKDKSAKKRKNNSAKVKSPGFFRRFLNEWRDFKAENREALRQLKVCRNSCFVGSLLVFIYCGIGGIIFHSTEGAFEMFYKCGVKRVKRDFLDTLWSKSNYMREEEWKSTARNKLMEFENQLYDAYEAGMNSYSGQRGWSFINSLIYCITLVTTIGYGHIAPKTTVGRIITIVYALFGVPMFLIMLADYGKLLTRGIKFLWAFVRRLYYTGSCRKVRRTAPVQEMVKGVQLVFDMTKLRRPSTMAKEGEPTFPCPTSPTGTPALSSYTIDDEFNIPVSVAFAILVLYMLAGAVLIAYIEGWPVFESFYFVYISILTIGLGDLVLTSTGFLWSLLYLIFGLALTSMCINVVQEKLSDSFRQATAKIGATMGLEVTDDMVLNVPVMNQNQTTDIQ